jgi:NDP-sugar pyrophosphorylase family protein
MTTKESNNSEESDDAANIKQAVILAGGLGTRLRPITYTYPKSMIDVNGRPFLEYLIKYLKGYGYEDILLLVGYKWEMIEEYFGDGSKFGVNLSYSVEDEPLGTGGAIKNAYLGGYLEKRFLLLYGDTYYPLDLHSFVEFYKSSGADNCITAYTNSEKKVQNNLWVEDGLVKEYNKTEDNENMNAVEPGTSIFSRVMLSLTDKTKFSLEIDLYPKLIDMAQLGAYVSDTQYYDIGTPERMKIIEGILK